MLVYRPWVRLGLLGICLAGLSLFPASALEKGGMPDLSQEEQTCLPTSTANLIIWFGHHGYPKLILSGDTEDDRELHTVHALMAATDASYQIGTRTDAITYGIKKYIHDAGYGCDVEYRGLDWTKAREQDIVEDDDGAKYRSEMTTPAPFTEDWLRQNDDPNKGFILLLAYCKFDSTRNTFSDAINAGHAVTLVNAEPNMILVHDPAHYSDEPGRKILTPTPLTGGVFQLPGYSAPVAGLLLLSGSELESPPDSGVMLTGAVCITMHPASEGSKILGSPPGSPNGTVGGVTGNTGAPPAAPAAPASAPSSTSSSWAMWLFDLIFSK